MHDLTSNCNIHNTGNILSIIPVLYQSIVTCMHEINYAIVLRTLLYLRYQQGMKPRIGEMVILKDYPDAKDWYVAEISQVLSDRFTVNGFITTGIPLAGYARATRGERVKALKGITFLRTWCNDKGNCGSGDSQSVKWISYCLKGMCAWTRMDACARRPGNWQQH